MHHFDDLLLHFLMCVKKRCGVFQIAWENRDEVADRLVVPTEFEPVFESCTILRVYFVWLLTYQIEIRD